MKVLLLNPPFPMEARYGKGLKGIGTVLPPLGILYVAASLEKNGYEVAVLDAELHELGIEETVQRIEKIRPDIVGITCSTSNFYRCVALSKKLKERLDAAIILGGPHTSVMPKEILKEKEIDFIVIGEGDLTTVELLNALKDGRELKNIKGIGYKEAGEIKINEKAEFIKNLDELPFPARHLVDLRTYEPSPNHYKETPYTTMVASRGCPFACTFCNSSAIWRQRYRQRSVGNVIEEIKFLIKEYGIKDIGFWDDVFGINKKWINEFCNALKQQGIKINWSCEMRVDGVDKETLKNMKEAGCWCIFYGVESMEQDILDAIEKKGYC